MTAEELGMTHVPNCTVSAFRTEHGLWEAAVLCDYTTLAICRATTKEGAEANAKGFLQVRALPDLIAAATAALPFLQEHAGNTECRKAGKAYLDLESALEKAGVKL